MVLVWLFLFQFSAILLQGCLSERSSVNSFDAHLDIIHEVQATGVMLLQLNAKEATAAGNARSFTQHVNTTLMEQLHSAHAGSASIDAPVTKASKVAEESLNNATPFHPRSTYRLPYTFGNIRLIPSKKVLVCACAKCGSTSLYEFIYRRMFGKPWKYTDGPWVQDVSLRWEDQLVEVNASMALNFIHNSEGHSFAFVRDPRERLISAWKSKVACGDRSCWHTDVQSRNSIVASLLALAGKTRNADCLSFNEFVDTMYLIDLQGKSSLLDQHLLPQHLGCFKDVPLEKWSMVRDIADRYAASELGVDLGDLHASSFPKDHMSVSGRCTEEVGVAAAKKLDAITKAEYLGLGMDPQSHQTQLTWLRHALGAEAK